MKELLYTSINNQKIKELIKLKTKKHRDKQNLFLVEGKHLTEEAYKNGYLKELLLLENINLKLDIETNYINENVLKHLSSVQTPSGIIGICQKKENKLIGNKLLILDSIQDPGNAHGGCHGGGKGDISEGADEGREAHSQGTERRRRFKERG